MNFCILENHTKKAGFYTYHEKPQPTCPLVLTLKRKISSFAKEPFFVFLGINLENMRIKIPDTPTESFIPQCGIRKNATIIITIPTHLKILLMFYQLVVSI